MAPSSYYTECAAPRRSDGRAVGGVAAAAATLAGLALGAAGAAQLYAPPTAAVAPAGIAGAPTLRLPRATPAMTLAMDSALAPQGPRGGTINAAASAPMDTASAAVPVAAVLAVLGAALGGFVLGRRGPAPVSAAARPVPPPENRLEHRIAMAAFLGERDAGLQYARLRTRLSAVATGDLGACHNGKFLSAEQKAELERIAQLIGTPGKGITACDEGPATIGGRFEAVGIVNTEENRRLYRQMLFAAPGANQYLSAAILDPETVFQKNDAGRPFPEVLMDLGIVPGVKPHLKVYELPGQSGSTVMQGLDSLAARCREYKAAGCRFAKWRSPLIIDVAAGQPSDMVIAANMNDLARYALICQAEGLVPIVEPDISMSGDHDLETAVYINVKVQSVLYKAMLDHGVFMEGTILKSNMVNPGKKCPIPYSVEDIAKANVDVLRRCFPVAIRSANFLSGGQSLEDAAARLSAINRVKGNSPWNLSFSWSAALQMPLFQLCKGKGQLCLPEMADLYLQELAIASQAAKGELVPQGTAGAHVPK